MLARDLHLVQSNNVPLAADTVSHICRRDFAAMQTIMRFFHELVEVQARHADARCEARVNEQVHQCCLATTDSTMQVQACTSLLEYALQQPVPATAPVKNSLQEHYHSFLACVAPPASLHASQRRPRNCRQHTALGGCHCLDCWSSRRTLPC